MTQLAAPNYSWTAADEATLRKLWDDDGLSAGEISKHFNGAMSRNAVIGKVTRLGLSRRRLSGAKSDATTRAMSRARRRVERLREAKRAAPFIPVQPGDKRALRGSLWAALPGVTPVSLVDLESDQCKWPIGQDRPYLFCGEQIAGTGPYCQFHKSASEKSN